MTLMKRLILTLVLVGIFLSSHSQEKPYLVVLSLDGLRWDYTDKAATPTLDSIARHGVRAESVKPAFPSLTFPNHYSMATGLYPDHHGIVHNSFYDPATNKYYRIDDRIAVEDGSFYQGEPIWATAEKQGITTASYYWVGTEALIGGIQPTYWKRYDEQIPFSDRIDTVISWLSLPEERRPHLVLFYYHEPDGLGHTYGPESSEVKDCIHELDSMVGVLCHKLNTLPAAGSINLAVTSDHGMQPLSESNAIKAYKYLKKKWFSEIQGYNPVVNLQFRAGYEEKAMKALEKIPHTTSWGHENIPESLHYGTNPRTLDATLQADSGYTLVMKKGGNISKGAHGYDPENRNMHAIFYAIGPAFKKDYSQPSFENVDLVPLFGWILGLDLAPTDGIFQRVEGMLAY